jgi:hypothetical protein
MSKKIPASKSKKSDPLLKKALATTAANIARIEAVERGVATISPEADTAPITQIVSAGSPTPRKAGRAVSGKHKKIAAGKTKSAKPPKAKESRARAASESGGREKKAKRISGLDAAAKVLAESKEPMNSQAIIKAMAEKGYWSSPKGKTPHATLHAAIGREIKEKGKDARFVKKDRGLFVANG